MTKALSDRMDVLERRMDRLEREGGRQLLAVAGLELLDSPQGDKLIRHDPKDWGGRSYIGYRMSQCPPDYLDMQAALYQWMAEKDASTGRRTAQGYPTAGFNRSDAALCRGWAQRKRDGWTGGDPPKFLPGGAQEVAKDLEEIQREESLVQAEAEDDEIPF